MSTMPRNVEPQAHFSPLACFRGRPEAFQERCVSGTPPLNRHPHSHRHPRQSDVLAKRRDDWCAHVKVLRDGRTFNRQLGAALCQPLLLCCFVPLRECRDLADANQQLDAWVMAPAGNRADGATGGGRLQRFAAYHRMSKIVLNLDFS